MSLIKQSIQTCDYTVVSIFVNPRQFSPNEDLDIYPYDLSRDLEKLESAGVNALFHPEKGTIYPKGFKTNIEVGAITDQLCGKSRPDLFRGVATVIVKLFNIIRPQHAFFGEKDWQQLAVIETLVRDLNIDVQIHRVPLIRESDGLAMSSRNSYLSKSDQKTASIIYRSLEEGKKLIISGERDAGVIREKIIRS